MGKIHGTADDQAIAFRHGFDDAVCLIIKHAALLSIPTGMTGNAVLDRVIAQPESLVRYAFLGEGIRYDVQRLCGAALLPGASVNEQYFHGERPPLIFRFCQAIHVMSAGKGDLPHTAATHPGPE